MGSWFLFLRCLWLKLKETVLRWLLAVDTSPNALAISPHTMGIFSGRYLFMKHEAHCRGLRYRPRMLWLRIMQARGPGGSESGEIELLTPPESQRAFGWVKFSPTSCERWVKGGLGNVARVTARGGRACWEGGEDGQTDGWMGGIFARESSEGRLNRHLSSAKMELIAELQVPPAWVKTVASQQTEMCSTYLYYPKYTYTVYMCVSCC